MRKPLAGFTFDEAEINYEFRTPDRMITARHVADFVGLTGDETVHTGEEYGGRATQGAPVVHGALALSMVIGMVAGTGLFEGEVVAFLETSARFIKVVKFNDVLSVSGRILAKRTTSRGDRGIVVIGAAVSNQRAEPVMECKWTMMLRRNAGATADKAPIDANDGMSK
jgi:3-hydroxybutyryl-CoA dehydratase